MISAITSGEYSLNYLKYNTTTAQKLPIFFQVLAEFVKRVEGVEGSEGSDIGVILDNCQSHKTETVKEFALSLSRKLYFLPSYSPELAPVETYLSILKNNLIKEAEH